MSSSVEFCTLCRNHPIRLDELTLFLLLSFFSFESIKVLRDVRRRRKESLSHSLSVSRRGNNSYFNGNSLGLNVERETRDINRETCKRGEVEEEEEEEERVSERTLSKTFAFKRSPESVERKFFTR